MPKLVDTLLRRQNRRMFGSLWMEDGTLKVFCHSGAFLFINQENGKVIQISFYDTLYGAICLDEAATECLLEHCNIADDVKNFEFVRKRQEKITTTTSYDRRNERESKKLDDYKDNLSR